jgi:hypothetical protein
MASTVTVEISRKPPGFLLETAIKLPRPRRTVFEFFADAHNLQSVTPPPLHFEILTPSRSRCERAC